MVLAGNNAPPELWLESDANEFNGKSLAGSLALSFVLHVSLAGSVYYLLDWELPLHTGYAQSIDIDIVRAEQAKMTKPEARQAPLESVASTVRQKPVLQKKRVEVTPDSAVPVSTLKEAPILPEPLKKVIKPSAAVLQADMMKHSSIQQVAIATSVKVLSASAQSIRPVYAPRPVYPKPARRLGLEGQVLLGVWVTVNGEPDVIVVKKSSGYESLDDSAKAGVYKWRFDVHGGDGGQLGSWVDLPVTFRLE